MIRKIIILAAILIVAAAAFGYFTGGVSMKAYTNQTLGFEIEYPETWRSEECTYEQYGIVSFGDHAEPLLICNSDAPPLSYINVNVIGPAGDLEGLLKNTFEGLDNSRRSDDKLDGKPAVRIYGETRPTEGPGVPVGTKMTFVFAEHSGKIYLVSHWNLENKDYLS